MVRAGLPSAMIFVQSLKGLSHTREEDTRPEHLELAVQALDRSTTAAMAWAARRTR
jgi:N-carbamoyl-L-amino-acid hydrolase